MDRGDQQATIHRVAQNWTRLNNYYLHQTNCGKPTYWLHPQETNSKVEKQICIDICVQILCTNIKPAHKYFIVNVSKV